MIKLKIRNTITFIILQTVIVLFVFEIGFRIAGFIKESAFKSEIKGKKDSFVVLCLGDSTTEGLGAPKGFSYPQQLQNLLNEGVGKDKLKVINVGAGGMNSSQVLNRLNKNIASYRPDLIILLIGINDSWNMNESNIWMFDESDILNRIKLKIDLFLSKIKIYQFAKLLILSRRSPELSELNEERRLFAKSFERYQEKQKQLYKLLSYNIIKIINIAKQNKIIIFVLTYQKEGTGGPRRLINQIYETVDIPIVDNQTILEAAAARGLKVISEDNYHPNKLGYSLIAKNVYNTLIEQGIIKAERLDLF